MKMLNALQVICLYLLMVALATIVVFFMGCDYLQEQSKEAHEHIAEQVDEIDGNSDKKPTQTPIPDPKPTPITIPANCKNPPANSGLKCLGSRTRGNSVVCLLPYTCTLGKEITKFDDQDPPQPFACAENKVDHVDLVTTSKKGKITRRTMTYADCHNPIWLPGGNIGREHFRIESLDFNKIKNKKNVLEISLGSESFTLGVE